MKMASIQAQIRNNKTHYYLAEWLDGKTVKTYLGTKPPIAKSRGWTNLSPEIVTRHDNGDNTIDSPGGFQYIYYDSGV